MNKPLASSRLHAKPQAAEEVAGDNLLSRWTHYHRPRVLIGRVRDGNGSFHPGLVTGSSVPPCGGVSMATEVGMLLQCLSAEP